MRDVRSKKEEPVRACSMYGGFTKTLSINALQMNCVCSNTFDFERAAYFQEKRVQVKRNPEEAQVPTAGWSANRRYNAKRMCERHFARDDYNTPRREKQPVKTQS